MSEITYAYAETIVRVSARSVSVIDPFKDDPEPKRTVEGLEVEVATVADNNDLVTVELLRGDRELSAALSPDGRLQSLEYNSVGVGARAVTGLAKVVAFVGSIALAVAGGRPAGGDEVTARDADKEWSDKFQADAAMLEKYKSLHTDAADKLHELRTQVLGTTNVAELRGLTVRLASTERVTVQAAAEVARIVQLKAAWIEGERSRVTSDLQTVVRFEHIARRSATDSAPPTPPSDGPAGDLWKDFGLLLEERPAERQRATPTMSDGKTVKSTDFPSHDDGTEVLWRVPRETELWVWKQGVTEHDDPVLVSREILWVSDHECRAEGFRLTTSIFGEHGGSLSFGDDGRPVSLRQKQQSTVGAVFDAFAAVPEAVSGSVTAAKTTAESLSSLRDLQATRALADAERQVNLAKKKLELAGIEATASDYAALQEAEQAVKLQTARQSLAPPSPDALAALKRELETVTTQNALAAERRVTELDIDLAELRSEIARVELEVKLQASRDPQPPVSGDGSQAS